MKNHWENIYASRKSEEVSWYQQNPVTSLEFIDFLNIRKDAKIIDIGGGDSCFADRLLERGFSDITVLDISETALKRARERLGADSKKVKWIAADITEFSTQEKYDFWHDRAAFHFLTTDSDIQTYVNLVSASLTENGFLVLGTFSETGPKKCSGLDIKQYSETKMISLLQQMFEKIKCLTVNHETPFSTVQNFIFCSFRKLHVS